MTRALLVTTLLVLGGAVTACGGDAPADASVEDFCGGLTAVGEAYGEVDPEAPTEEQVSGIKEAVADLVDIGTPEDISDDAREGFDLVTGSVADLDDDASVEELEQAGEEFSGSDEEKADAFDEYVEQTCDDLSGGDE